jgi:hypothetical protein
MSLMRRNPQASKEKEERNEGDERERENAEWIKEFL